MRCVQANTMRFIRLATAMRQLGARSPKAFLADLRTLSDRERREVANLVKQEG